MSCSYSNSKAILFHSEEKSWLCTLCACYMEATSCRTLCGIATLLYMVSNAHSGVYILCW